jgi:hypothetical protein
MTVSIISLVIAAVALTLTLRREVLDRPQLVVMADPMVTPGGPAEIVFTVENRGRQPTTVGEIGMAWDVQGEDEMPEGRRQGELLANDPWSRADIGPGQHHQIRWTASSLHVPLDTPMRPFASHGGRRTWGKLNVPLRLLDLMGWQPSPAPSEELRRRREKPLVALPVVSPWRMWKPKDLRRPAPVPAPFPDLTREEVTRRVAQAAAKQYPKPDS